jgi:hypothetical protein
LVRDLHGLMKELLSQIRQGTLDACRDDVSRHQARSQKRPEPWSELRALMKDSSTPPAPAATPKGIGGSFLLETAASRADIEIFFSVCDSPQVATIPDGAVLRDQ